MNNICIVRKAHDFLLNSGSCLRRNDGNFVAVKNMSTNYLTFTGMTVVSRKAGLNVKLLLRLAITQSSDSG